MPDMTREEAAREIEENQLECSDPTCTTRGCIALRMAIAALRSPAPGAEAMREAAAKVADDHDCLYADGRGTAVAECQESIAAAIRALPLPARAVPEEVKAWCLAFDDEDFDITICEGPLRAHFASVYQGREVEP